MIYRKVKKSELKYCAEVLVDSFSGYPFFEVFIDNEKRRFKFFKEIQKVWIKTCYKKQNVFVGIKDNKIVAVAVLQSPKNKEITNWDYIISGGIKVLFVGGIKNTLDFLKLTEETDSICHNIPNPKWYLTLLAISGNCKGQGVGSDMLSKCIKPYISRNGGGVFILNTNSQINCSFYKKNGFIEFSETTFYVNNKELGSWNYKMEIPNTDKL